MADLESVEQEAFFRIPQNGRYCALKHEIREWFTKHSVIEFDTVSIQVRPYDEMAETKTKLQIRNALRDNGSNSIIILLCEDLLVRQLSSTHVLHTTFGTSYGNGIKKLMWTEIVGEWNEKTTFIMNKGVAVDDENVDKLMLTFLRLMHAILDS